MAQIYAIKCLVNGYAYVGCTKGNLAKRMREHRCLLRSNSHKCTKLQFDWKEYGEDQFTIEVLEKLPQNASVAIKREGELKWMKMYEDQSKLYNLYLVSYRPTEEARIKGVANAHNKPGNRWTLEANLKRSLSQIGIPKGRGAKISATKKARKVVR